MFDRGAYCLDCNVEYPPHAKYCKWCGAMLVSTATSDTCPQCGVYVEEGLMFCDNCGARLATEMGHIPATDLINLEEGKVETVGPKCVDCLTPFEAGAAFCMECGARLPRAARVKGARPSWTEPVVQVQEAPAPTDGASGQPLPLEPVVVAPVVELARCPWCAGDIEAGGRFCELCGFELASPNGDRSRSVSVAAACAECGTEVQAKAKFCESCGAPLMREEVGPAPQAEEIQVVHQCERCGAMVEAGVKVCQSCEASDRIGAGSSAERPAITTGPTEVKAASRLKVAIDDLPITRPCPSCGALLPLDVESCGACGYSFVASPPIPLWVETEEPAAKDEAIIEPEPTEPCPDCGAPMPLDVGYCGNCGYSSALSEPIPLEIKLAAVVEPSEEIKVEAPPPPASEAAATTETEMVVETEAVIEKIEPAPIAPATVPKKVKPKAAEKSKPPLQARPHRRGMKAAVTLAGLVFVIGVGGWLAYQQHAPTQTRVNQWLMNLGVLESALTIRTSPGGCRVLIDGRGQGVTDGQGRLILPNPGMGVHTIVVSLEGYETQERLIEVTAPNVEEDFTLSRAIPEGMVYVPGGTFEMGRDDGDEYERPAHEVTVAPFYIDRFEVTCEDYQKFIDATGHPAPPGWVDGRFPLGVARWPVTQVSWHDATAYARWAGKRLPTEEEWEFAARGGDGRLYPWGHQWQPGAANMTETGHNGVVRVGTYSAGASPFGVVDMVGNVWEWTASHIRSYPGGKIQEDSLPQAERENLKVIRGGCYLSRRNEATTTYRMGYAAQGQEYAQTGFRCVKDIQ